jgi:hypothetical protein
MKEKSEQQQTFHSYNIDDHSSHYYCQWKSPESGSRDKAHLFGVEVKLHHQIIHGTCTDSE